MESELLKNVSGTKTIRVTRKYYRLLSLERAQYVQSQLS